MAVSPQVIVVSLRGSGTPLLADATAALGYTPYGTMSTARPPGGDRGTTATSCRWARRGRRPGTSDSGQAADGLSPGRRPAPRPAPRPAAERATGVPQDVPQGSLTCSSDGPAHPLSALPGLFRNRSEHLREELREVLHKEIDPLGLTGGSWGPSGPIAGPPGSDSVRFPVGARLYEQGDRFTPYRRMEGQLTRGGQTTGNGQLLLPEPPSDQGIGQAGRAV